MRRQKTPQYRVFVFELWGQPRSIPTNPLILVAVATSARQARRLIAKQENIEDKGTRLTKALELVATAIVPNKTGSIPAAAEISSSNGQKGGEMSLADYEYFSQCLEWCRKALGATRCNAVEQRQALTHVLDCGAGLPCVSAKHLVFAVLGIDDVQVIKSVLNGEELAAALQRIQECRFRDIHLGVKS